MSKQGRTCKVAVPPCVVNKTKYLHGTTQGSSVIAAIRSDTTENRGTT